MAGQGRGTFFMAPPGALTQRQTEKKKRADLLKEGRGPVKSSGVPDARSLMQQADPFDISGRFF